MKEQEFNYIKTLINQDIANNNRKDLEKLKIYLEEKLKTTIYDRALVLNVNLREFLQNEKTALDIKRKLNVDEITHYVAQYFNISLELLTVNHLTKVSYKWLLKQKNVGQETIKTLNIILNRYGYGLKVLNDNKEEKKDCMLLSQLLQEELPNEEFKNTILKELANYWQFPESLITVNKLAYLNFNDPMVQNSFSKKVLDFLQELLKKYHISYIDNNLQNQTDILNWDLKGFLKKEKERKKFKKNFYIADIINVVGIYRHIPNNMTKVGDLIGMDLNWFIGNYHMSSNIITYLEYILNQYNLSLTANNENIRNWQEARKNLHINILYWDLETFILNHVPAYEQNYINWPIKEAIKETLKTDRENITVKDAIKALQMGLDTNNWIVTRLKLGLKRYEDTLLKLNENKAYLLKL